MTGAWSLGLLALAGVAVDDDPLRAVDDRRRRQHEVDAHAPTLVEVAAPVVPPRERRAWRRGSGAGRRRSAHGRSSACRRSRSGGLTWVAPSNTAGSYTSTSAGAMLKSPATITGAPSGGDGVQWAASRSSQRSLYW